MALFKSTHNIVVYILLEHTKGLFSVAVHITRYEHNENSPAMVMPTKNIRCLYLNMLFYSHSLATCLILALALFLSHNVLLIARNVVNAKADKNFKYVEEMHQQSDTKI